MFINRIIKSTVFLVIYFMGISHSSAIFTQELPLIVSEKAGKANVYLPDFSYAGYDFGLTKTPYTQNVINVKDHGAIPNDGKDDSKALLAAMKAAHASNEPVRVQFSAGRYILTEILWIEKSGITLSGMGSGVGGTQLYMPRPLNQVDDNGALKEIREYLVELNKRERQPVNNIDVIFSEYSWSAGFIWTRAPNGRHATYLERYDRPINKVADISNGKKGNKNIIVDNSKALKVGDVLQIHWHNNDGQNGPLISALYGDTKEKIGSRHWSIPERPLVRQATRIESIKGNKVTIADPLLLDISKKLPAYFAHWDHIKNVGLQDFAMEFPENPFFGHHVEAGFNGVYFTGVHNGWISNVKITNADAGIMTDDVANVTISNITTDGTHRAHYSVHVGNVHNVLINNVDVRNPTEHTFSFNTQATKSVYKNSSAWVNPTLDQHSGANHQNLYDNLTLHITPNRQAADGTPSYELFKAGGAGYWWPGHARYNTFWNVNILVDGGVEPNKEVVILGVSEGPESRIIGMHGNRPIRLDYRPAGYIESHNERINSIPSLYDFQLTKRKQEK